MELSQLIKQKRRAQGLSVPKLSGILGISQERIYKWEKGVKPSDAEERLILEAWLADKPTPMYSRPTLTARTGVNHEGGESDKERIIESLKDQIQSLKNQVQAQQDEIKFLKSLLITASEKK